MTVKPPSFSQRLCALFAGAATVALLPGGLSAQIDYRNLDDDRPTLIEDAYPVERHAFELLAPWRFGKDRHGGSTHAFTPELAYGILSNAQVGVKLPIAGVATSNGRNWGISGLRVFALYNFNTETPLLPALSLRGDVTLPVGGLAGEGTRLSLKAIATRSWGRNRLHLNGAYTFGRDRLLGAVEGAHKWWAGGAVDRTLYRQSLLVVGEVYALRSVSADPVQLNAALGIRYQVTPYLVFDAGLARRLRREVGPDYEVTMGFSRSFAIAALMPSRGAR